MALMPTWILLAALTAQAENPEVAASPPPTSGETSVLAAADLLQVPDLDIRAEQAQGWEDENGTHWLLLGPVEIREGKLRTVANQAVIRLEPLPYGAHKVALWLVDSFSGHELPDRRAPRARATFEDDPGFVHTMDTRVVPDGSDSLGVRVLAPGEKAQDVTQDAGAQERLIERRPRLLAYHLVDGRITLTGGEFEALETPPEDEASATLLHEAQAAFARMDAQQIPVAPQTQLESQEESNQRQQIRERLREERLRPFQ